MTKATNGGRPPARQQVTEELRRVMREIVTEVLTQAGITDGAEHKADHHLLRQLRPVMEQLPKLMSDLNADVIPYFRLQRQVQIDKQTDNREVFKTIKIWALKLVISLLALSLFYGGLQAAVSHLSLLSGG